MKGKLTILKVDGSVSETDLTSSPSLEQLQAAVGGYIEVVPFFTRYKGQSCVAFCNEEGKCNGLPLNKDATMLWYVSMSRSYAEDYLVGDIAIITGDRDIFRNL